MGWGTFQNAQNPYTPTLTGTQPMKRPLALLPDLSKPQLQVIRQPQTSIPSETQNIALGTFQQTKEVLEINSQLSDDHLNLIKFMSLGLASQLTKFGTHQGRFVYDSDCGLGKSTTLKSLIKTIAELGLSRSLLIASAEIEPSCQMINELIDEGVNSELLGIFHGSPSASIPSVSSNQTSKIQFLFVSHARFSFSKEDSAQWVSDFYTFNNRERSLCIWDESIKPAEAIGVSHWQLLSLHSHLDTCLKGRAMDDAKRKALSTFRKQVSIMFEGLEDGIDDLPTAVDSIIIDCPTLLSEDARQQLQSLLESNQFFGKAFAALREVGRIVIDLSGCKCRLVYSANELSPEGTADKTKCGMTSFFVNVPEALKNIAILDASYTANKVLAIDKTINKHPLMSKVNVDAIKRYNHVTLHIANKGSGKNKFEEEWSDKFKAGTLRAAVSEKFCEDSSISTMFVGNKEVPVSSPDRSFQSALLRDLKKAEVPDQHLTNNVSCLTWGRHTSSNKFSNCSRVLFASVLNLPELNVAYDAIATAQDLFYDYTKESPLREMLLGKKVEAVHQALSRACLREVFVDDGGLTQAKPCDIYFADWNDVEPVVSELKRLMSGINITSWEFDGSRSAVGELATYTKMVSEHIDKLPEFVTSFKTKDLKTGLKLKGKISPKFSDACREVANASDVWFKSGQTWTRTSSLFTD